MKFNWDEVEEFTQRDFRKYAKSGYVATINKHGQLFINKRWKDLGFDISLKYVLAYGRESKIIALKPSTESHAFSVIFSRQNRASYMSIKSFLKHFQIDYPQTFTDVIKENDYWVLVFSEREGGV